MSEQKLVRVCVGTNCCFTGGETLVELLEGNADLAGRVRIEAVPCLERACDGGKSSPVVEVDGKILTHATIEGILEMIEQSFQGLGADHA